MAAAAGCRLLAAWCSAVRASTAARTRGVQVAGRGEAGGQGQVAGVPGQGGDQAVEFGDDAAPGVVGQLAAAAGGGGDTPGCSRRVRARGTVQWRGGQDRGAGQAIVQQRSQPGQGTSDLGHVSVG
jgi:hypothetical protein